ncbi:MAG: UDP-N-acetyl-D-glucosamine dehydrogenase [Actinomycetota bacterium]|jgi:nucleotide sugar dehydrogenase|nr:UDP-N-acetyl-D-glucosamine dehydrogenase [Actinomycetota bacterium]
MTPELRRLKARIEDRQAKVVVVGQGYVGLPVAMRASDVGFPVVGYDVTPARIDELRAGRSYVGDVSDAQVATARAAGYVPSCAAADLEGFDIAVITVQTPLIEGTPDLSFIEAAGNELARHLTPGALVILESTTYPGTTEELLRPILEAGGLRADVDFFMGYSPERIDPGNSTFTFVNTAKVVAGIGPDSLSVVEDFYGCLVDKIVPVASTGEAELVKLLENTFRHVNIALVNELAMFARDLGVDIWAAIDAAATKPYGFMRFTPGPGAGGHCLPIDPSYLAWRVERQLGHRFRFVELANEVNRGMPEYVVSRVISMLNNERRSVNGSRILVLGLAYKAGTSDWRESPAMTIVEQLLALGADVRAHDSHIPADARLGPPFPRVDCSREELAAADLVVLCVDHPDLPFDEIAEHARLVLDTRGRLRGIGFRGETL